MNMKDHAAHFGTQFISQTIEKVDFSSRSHKLWTHKGEEIIAQSVIIATGATPKRLNIPGEDELWGKGVTTCAVCDGAFYKDKKVIVIGGGDTAMEDASFLKRFTNDITIVHILDKFTASHAMQKRVLEDNSIKKIYNSTAIEFHAVDQKLTAVTIQNQKTKETTKMDMDGAFIAIGLNPNTKPFQEHVACDKWGYITVHDQVKTSVEGVFAAGDVHDFKYRQAITSAGAGCMAALEAERYLESID